MLVSRGSRPGGSRPGGSGLGAGGWGLGTRYSGRSGLPYTPRMPLVEVLATEQPQRPTRRVAISVLVPIYNEEENIPALCEQLLAVLDAIEDTFEVILINDGSSDASLARLRSAAKTRREIKVIHLRRNCGQTGALMAGIDHASGEIIVPMDGDLQNDPRDIPRLVAKLEEGFDVVSGWRRDRKDARFRRNFVSRMANRLISWIFKVPLHDYGCTLKAYRRDVIKGVRLYGEMHRFIPVYAAWQGARVTELPVRHHPRLAGRSKYGLTRVVKVLLDVLVVRFFDRYFTKPIYVFGSFGILSLGISVLAGLYTLYLKFVVGKSFISTPMPLLTVMTFITGSMSILMGLLAEMIVRTYFESQQRGVYLVREMINFEE